MSSHNYIVAFNRDRDFYQLPWALAEDGKLELLVTDLYCPSSGLGKRLFQAAGLAHRHCRAIPDRKVRSSLKAVLWQVVGLRLAGHCLKKDIAYHAIDSELSSVAGKEALRRKASLFLYSGYALEAFHLVSDTQAQKLLFVYHPQGDYVRGILERDFENHPEVEASHAAHLSEISINEGERVLGELRMADRISCASSFTAASVTSALGPGSPPPAVIPYGCFTAHDQSLDGQKRRTGLPRVLYVGQGNQRKGLHHLIKVWSQGLFKIAELTLVLSSVDPGIQRLISSLSVKPRVLSHISRAQLNEEYVEADIFVLPSLVEGFGLVYLEAFAAGCHVVGTRNTGLPDLHPTADIASIIEAGDLEALHKTLHALVKRVAAGEMDRNSARRFAEERSWEQFRAAVKSFVSEA